eukprot:COSAG01_NODE_3148_length_6514_cov_194.153079_5_plen_167_part_00
MHDARAAAGRRPQRRDAIGDAPVEYTRMEQAALSQGHHDMDDEEVLGMLDSIDVSTSSSDDEWDDAKEDAEQPQQPQQQPALPGGAGMPGVAPAEGIPPSPGLGPGSLLLEPEPELAPGGSAVPPKAAVWEFDNSAQPWKGQPEKWEAYSPELSHALGARARRVCV